MVLFLCGEGHSSRLVNIVDSPGIDHTARELSYLAVPGRELPSVPGSAWDLLTSPQRKQGTLACAAGSKKSQPLCLGPHCLAGSACRWFATTANRQIASPDSPGVAIRHMNSHGWDYPSRVITAGRA